jgi:hypothetical protein
VVLVHGMLKGKEARRDTGEGRKRNGILGGEYF